MEQNKQRKAKMKKQQKILKEENYREKRGKTNEISRENYSWIEENRRKKQRRQANKDASEKVIFFQLRKCLLFINA